MPPRLNHTKSRQGCIRCKARKVKCGEEKPRCQNCIKHNALCEYRKQPFKADLRTSPAPGPSLEGSLSPDDRRKLELQLLHYFESSVVWTMGSSHHTAGREVWAYTAVELGFKHPFLQNAIFAFTTLYLLKSTPDSRQIFAPPEYRDNAFRAVNREITIDCAVPLSTVHELYLDLALRQQRDASHHLTPDTANAFWLSTMLHWYQSLPQFSPELQVRGYTPPVQWLRMAQANKTFAMLSRQLMPDEHLIEKVSGELGPDFDDHEALYGKQNYEPFMELLDWSTHPESQPCSPKTVQIYETFLAYVGSIYKGLLQKEPSHRNFRRLICLGIFMPGEVMTLIEEQRPRALAVLALYFSMGYAQNDHWTWHGLADREVEGIASIMPDDWLWAMEKPKAILRELKTTVMTKEMNGAKHL